VRSVKTGRDDAARLIMRSPLLKIVTALWVLTATASGQTRVWRVQSPCDGSFSVEVPSPLFEVSWFEGKHGAEIEPDSPFDRDTRSYVSFQKDPKTRQFGIAVFDVSKDTTEKERAEYAKGNFGRFDFMIGGDDAEATSESPVRAGGLIGREYFFKKEIQADTYTRGRIFYADARLYFVILRATTPDDLASPDAARFLDSFRIARRRASPRRTSR
jgi:hypothetical protein